jgi:hypothetical protein
MDKEGYAERTQFIRDAILEKVEVTLGIEIPAILAAGPDRRNVGGKPTHKTKIQFTGAVPEPNSEEDAALQGGLTEGLAEAGVAAAKSELSREVVLPIEHKQRRRANTGQQKGYPLPPQDEALNESYKKKHP